ncbi:hypothetical protein FPRO03_05085 [Fusarium proliferatum]|nr:hypothetical protein FPRO03_05085 [Fusarium proliferatum]
MAEILGLASSIITIVEVAGKLGTNTIRLKRLWDEVQDVPASIQRCIEQLEILAPAIEEMDHEFEETRNMIQNDSAAKRSLEYSRKAVETLDTLVRDMETQISAAKASKRLVAQLKVRIKRDVIEDHQLRLTSALQLLSLSQQTYLIALSRAQPEIIISEIRNWRDSEYQKQISLAIEDDQFTEGEEPEKAEAVEARDYFKSPGSPNFSLWSTKKPLPRKRPGLLGSFAFQSYEVVESSSIHYVPDKARYKHQYMTWIPMEIHYFIKMESIKAILRMGMRISDVETEYLFGRVAMWFWSEPETSWPMELARIWQADIGGLEKEDWLDNGFLSAFWLVPNLYTILLEPGSIRQVIATFDFSYLDPAVPLELLRGGLAVAADFPPYVCSSSTDGICGCYSSSLIYEYFHALLNNEKTFHDWRCLARKALIGVSPLDIVHPHDGAFWNLTTILEVLWKRQCLLHPFARWIQHAVPLWLEDVAAAGINLEEYMSLELLYSREFGQDTVCKGTKVEVQPGVRLPESGPSLVILSVGPRANDWSFSWDPCVEELSGEFWSMLEDAQIKVPGAWVDERPEDLECIMRHRDLCWFRRWIKRLSNIAKGYNPKEEHEQQMRFRGLEGTERKGHERLRIRGMATCEEFSPYDLLYWN